MEQIGKGTTWVFRADNLDETYQTLSARGIKFLSPPKAVPWGREAIFENFYGQSVRPDGEVKDGWLKQQWSEQQNAGD